MSAIYSYRIVRSSCRAVHALHTQDLSQSEHACTGTLHASHTAWGPWYVCIYMCMCIHAAGVSAFMETHSRGSMYICIYIYRERERERDIHLYMFDYSLHWQMEIVAGRFATGALHNLIWASPWSRHFTNIANKTLGCSRMCDWTWSSLTFGCSRQPPPPFSRLCQD